jgi:alpha-tubulin suppressor-like RCC1 family protein
VTSAGGVRCWGFADRGQLGEGTIDGTSTGIRAKPVEVKGLPAAVTALSSFGDTVCVVAGGAVWCWGDNREGQLGDGSTTTSARPVQVTGLTSGWSGVAVGDDHACALAAAGVVRCWGKNEIGRAHV